MAASTGLIVAAGAITAGNELLHNQDTAALRAGVATLALAVVLAGVEKIPAGGQPLAVGLAATALVLTVFGSVTPGTPSPANQILALINVNKGNQKG